MSLRNLVGISLEVVTPDKAQVARLLAASERNISDAQLPGLSVENRFDAAYLWLAVYLRTPLATFDARLGKAAQRYLGSLGKG